MATEQDPLLRAENGEGKQNGRNGFNKYGKKETYIEDDITIKRVSFDSSSHISVLFQLNGSVWPKVLPYCLFNSLLSAIIVWLKFEKGIDITIKGEGHNFMGILVSFLVVTRVKTTYAKFMQARGYLEDTYRLSRQLVQDMCTLTKQNMSDEAKKWRRDVALQTLVLLRITMAATEFSNSQKSALDSAVGRTSLSKSIIRWSGKKGDDSTTNFRAPLLLAYALRTEILKKKNESFIKAINPVEELFILRNVDAFISGTSNILAYRDWNHCIARETFLCKHTKFPDVFFFDIFSFFFVSINGTPLGMIVN
uniref:Bestrophin homolog n=1 Tax=Ditylum brightwellii TaxID=49249 RepID=A0A7S4T542_9STRA|mmetsp:Transcript_43646/g.65909  ORF Transcript_43646/g.65909 Transcript_43646/m.65909 type:complete len:309 (+) Transcript_43646:76-1002(+)